MEEEIFETQKIISFLKRVRSINLAIDTIYKNVKTKSSVRYVGEYSFEIYCKEPLTITEPTIELEIALENKIYHIKTEILNKRENILLLMLPTRISIWTKRKFPRKNVYGKLYLGVSFIKQLDYPSVASMEEIPENLVGIRRELEKDLPDMKKIVSMVIREIEKISEKYDFVFYKRGMSLPSSAVVSMHFKSPLLVEDTSNLESYIVRYEGFNITTYGDYMRKMSWDETKVLEQIKKLRASFLSQNVKSFICVPIRVLNEVIGFIFCKSSQKVFSVKDALYIDALGSIISEAYIKNKINSVKNTTEMLFPVIDISAGGVRFEVDSIVGKLLRVGDSVRIFTNIEGRDIQVTGKILRIDTTKTSKKLWVAVMFTFVSAEDQEYILSFTTR
ncbi:MAG: PilZ domain-containing protein [Brevinematia bacterium]